MSIPIHYIKIKKNSDNVLEELFIARDGAPAPVRIKLSRVNNKNIDFAELGECSSLDHKTSNILSIAGKFI